MTSLCLDAYLSFALVFHGAVGDAFSGICYRERATCEQAVLAAGAAFALAPSLIKGLVLTANPTVLPEARCVPQPPTKIKR